MQTVQLKFSEQNNVCVNMLSSHSTGQMNHLFLRGCSWQKTPESLLLLTNSKATW